MLELESDGKRVRLSYISSSTILSIFLSFMPLVAISKLDWLDERTMYDVTKYLLVLSSISWIIVLGILAYHLHELPKDRKTAGFGFLGLTVAGLLIIIGCWLMEMNVNFKTGVILSGVASFSVPLFGGLLLMPTLHHTMHYEKCTWFIHIVAVIAFTTPFFIYPPRDMNTIYYNISLFAWTFPLHHLKRFPLLIVPFAFVSFFVIHLIFPGGDDLKRFFAFFYPFICLGFFLTDLYAFVRNRMNKNAECLYVELEKEMETMGELEKAEVLKNNPLANYPNLPFWTFDNLFPELMKELGAKELDRQTREKRFEDETMKTDTKEENQSQWEKVKTKLRAIFLFINS